MHDGIFRSVASELVMLNQRDQVWFNLKSLGNNVCKVIGVRIKFSLEVANSPSFFVMIFFSGFFYDYKKKRKKIKTN